MKKEEQGFYPRRFGDSEGQTKVFLERKKFKLEKKIIFDSYELRFPKSGMGYAGEDRTLLSIHQVIHGENKIKKEKSEF